MARKRAWTPMTLRKELGAFIENGGTMPNNMTVAQLLERIDRAIVAYSLGTDTLFPTAPEDVEA
jgi:hypothetical protein